MEPSPELIDRLFWVDVETARRMPDEEKLIAPARLFDMACRVMADGIRAQHPGISAQEVSRITAERLRLTRRLEQGS